MQSKAKTVAAYLDSLPLDRRVAIEAVRKVILENLGDGFAEGMQYGMIGYHVPHALYPAGYHCDPKQPLPFAGLASQKQYMSLYLMVQGEHAAQFRAAWEAETGRKIDMGVCCIRFKKLEDVALGVVGKTLRKITWKRFVAIYEQARADCAVSKPAARRRKPVMSAMTTKATKATKAKPRPARR